MKTENEVRVRLKDHRKNRKQTQRRYKREESDVWFAEQLADDLAGFDSRIAELEWVLGIERGDRG